MWELGMRFGIQILQIPVWPGGGGEVDEGRKNQYGNLMNWTWSGRIIDLHMIHSVSQRREARTHTGYSFYLQDQYLL